MLIWLCVHTSVCVCVCCFWMCAHLLVCVESVWFDPILLFIDLKWRWFQKTLLTDANTNTQDSKWITRGRITQEDNVWRAKNLSSIPTASGPAPCHHMPSRGYYVYISALCSSRGWYHWDCSLGNIWWGQWFCGKETPVVLITKKTEPQRRSNNVGAELLKATSQLEVVPHQFCLITCYIGLLCTENRVLTVLFLLCISLFYIMKHNMTRYFLTNRKNTLHVKTVTIKLIWIPNIMHRNKRTLRGNWADCGQYLSCNASGFWCPVGSCHGQSLNDAGGATALAWSPLGETSFPNCNVLTVSTDKQVNRDIWWNV